MKKFKFRLEKLLDAKKAKEKEIQHELAKAIGEQNVFRSKQFEYRAKVEAQKNEFHKRFAEKRVNFSELEMYHRFEVFAGKVIADSQQKIDALEPGINRIRGRLAEASKERRTIEKLKERRFSEWQYNVNRAEDKENDDTNQKIYVRRMLAQKMEDTDNDGRHVRDDVAH
jgi:flagellar FliJ protein